MLPAVLAIWGIILFKIFFKEGNNEEYMFTNSVEPQQKSIQDTLFSFALLNNYSDPFLKKTYHAPTKKRSETPKATKPKPIETPKIIQWPRLSYKGVIVSKDATFGMLEIDNEMHMVSAGDLIKTISIITIYPDSIRIKNDDVTRTFMK